jgi:hypothetical protein
MQEHAQVAMMELTEIIQAASDDELAGIVTLTHWLRRWHTLAGYQRILHAKYGGLFYIIKGRR